MDATGLNSLILTVVFLAIFSYIISGIVRGAVRRGVADALAELQRSDTPLHGIVREKPDTTPR